MSLPLVIDLALGIVFIYLILSLLASEIHELLTTLMQWRADHLKRSIRLMIDGGGKVEADRTLREADTERLAEATDTLTDRLYAHPLINTLNHEATGHIAVLMRKLGGGVVQASYKFAETLYGIFGRFFSKDGTPPRNPFARQTSAPSYIPADTFAQTVVETFELSKVGRLISLSRLQELKRQQLKDVLRQVKNLAMDESQELATDRLRQVARDYEQIALSFADGDTPLYVAIDRMGHGLSGFIYFCNDFIDASDPARPYFLYQLQYVYEKYYSDAEKPALIASLKPDLEEVLAMVRDKREMFHELRSTVTDTDSQIYKSLSNVIRNLPEMPPQLQKSLSSIATNVEQRAGDLEEDLRSLQGQIEGWFDKSMTRASGVYKRNSRGVAILIGFLVAVATNADTLFIVDTLSNDSVLRTTVSEFAVTQVEVQSLDSIAEATPEQLDAEIDAIKESVRESLDDVSLPLGWDEATLTLQAEENWKVPLTETPMPGVKRIVGWAISAIAISMGASFWYDLLRKLLGVKAGNTGGTGK